MKTLALLVTAVVWLAGAGPRALAQSFDCEDVDHDCDPADRTVASAIKRGGKTLIDCVKRGIDPCDLAFALAKVTDEQCRDAIECQVRALFAQVGDGSTDCVQRLFKEGYT